MNSRDGREVSREQDTPFGKRLRRLREAAGLTQEELAEKADLGAKGISDLERGERRRPYPHTVRALADALEVPEEERASLLATVPRRGGLVATPWLLLPSSPFRGPSRRSWAGSGTSER